MFCKNCGSKIINNSAFCANCGCDLRNIKTEINNINNENNINNHQNNSSNNNPKKTYKIILIIIFAIIALFVCSKIYNIYMNIVDNDTNIKDTNNNNDNDYNNNNNNNLNDNENSAKNKLIGEWDWGTAGYFVITDSTLYLYKDSSKSMNNVRYGSYTVYDGINTVSGGKVEGLDVIVNYTNSYIDGDFYELPSPEREYMIRKNNDGTYTITDIISNNTGIARKVK